MSSINYPRVILGGLVAAFICNVSGITVGGLFLVDEVDAFFDELGRRPASMQMLFTHVGLRVLLGLACVWLYAAIRPRFGRGPGTAMIAGLALFAVGYFPLGLLLLELGLYTLPTTIIALTWSLGEALLMTVAGAALYREPEPGV